MAAWSLGIEDAQNAKDGLVIAVEKYDTSKLAKIARFWDTGFESTTMPKDRRLGMGSPPQPPCAPAKSTSSLHSRGRIS